jgi:hypothetical protein
MFNKSLEIGLVTGAALIGMFVSLPLSAQDHDWGSHWDQNRGMYTQLEPGTLVAVRMNQTIDVERRDNRVYYGTVDRDVFGQNGRIAIPRGSNAELMVRVAPDNDLILDLESVVVNGQRFAVRSAPNRVESQHDNSIVGAIVGAVTGATVSGRAVRIPRDAVVSFRLDRALDMGVPDRGVDRDGNHYHDWYGHDGH